MKALFLKIFVFDTKSLNCEISACVFRCGPLLSAGTASAFDAQDVLVQVLRQDVAHLTCLALANGMSTLFAKHGFSRPSLEQCCGVFRHVLGLRLLAPSQTSGPPTLLGRPSIYAQPQYQYQNLPKEPYKKASSLCNRDEAILRVTTLLVEIKTIQPLKKYICKKRMCNSISFLPKFAPTTLSLFNCLETIYFSFSDKILNFNDTTEYTLFAVLLSIVFFILSYL